MAVGVPSGQSSTVKGAWVDCGPAAVAMRTSEQANTAASKSGWGCFMVAVVGYGGDGLDAR